ncbi:MAG TPA: cyclophane-forming radical SAM/SPASM peptide maturase GrrM/OscB [Dongiaceae bacterium]|nr:cyclophane-forming radical SAM/SPASM peptide maturase GrrM/OscB [Dongiaceae bacterium]
MLLIIQGTPFCNIDCSYCYLPDRDRRERLSLDTINRIVARLNEFLGTPPRDEEIAVVWHAGEPLVLPVSFYEQAFSAFGSLQTLGMKLSHAFQTNGTLINDRWVDFFRRTAPSIGVSIDGPQDIHDRYRTYRNGRGSFRDCIAGIRKLQVSGIPFHVISVLTEPALHRPDEIFDFFLENDLRDVGFNIEEIEGAHSRSSLAGADKVDLYRRFLRRFLYRNAIANFPLRLREAEQVATLLLKGELPENVQTEPGRIISIDVQGNVSTFSPELLGLKSEPFADFIIGNVCSSSFAAMLAGPVATALTAEIAFGVAQCRATCDVFAFCKGGAPVNKLCETGSMRSSETMHCALTVKATLPECVDFIYRSFTDKRLATGAPS